jgi:hypothetical protein
LVADKVAAAVGAVKAVVDDNVTTTPLPVVAAGLAPVVHAVAEGPVAVSAAKLGAGKDATIRRNAILAK